MANTTVKVIRTFGTSDGFNAHQEAVNEYLKKSNKELIDIKFSVDETRLYSMIIEKE